MSRIPLLLLFTFPLLVRTLVIVDSVKDDCNLDPKLVSEIASYKNVIRKIMSEIIDNGYGDYMYDKYEQFIDNYSGRYTGTDVLERAIDSMIILSRENGMNNITTEDIEVPVWNRLAEYGRILKPYYRPFRILGFGTSVSTSPNGIKAEAIVVKSFDELESLDNTAVKDKIVVYNVPYISYGDTVVYRTLGASKASKKGAIATLVRSVTPFSIYSLHTGAQFYEQNITKIPTAAITIEDAEYLNRLQDKGKTIELHIIMLNLVNVKKSRNTLIDLTGKEKPEKMVIVSGHIDCWDVGQGAMDDGGGMFISWFVPVILNKLSLTPKRTIRAILWSGEEQGLVGAQAYFKKHKDSLNDINFIMESDEGTFKPLGLDLAGSDAAVCIISEVLKQFSPLDKMTRSGAPGSDITLFTAKGIPGASLLNENERYYWFHHSEGDTLTVQKKADVIECAAFWAAVSYVIADLSVDIPRN